MDNNLRLWEAILHNIQEIRKNEEPGLLQKHLGRCLRWFTNTNNLYLVKKLTEEESADPNDEDTDGINSIMIAAANGDVSVLEYFISYGRVNLDARYLGRCLRLFTRSNNLDMVKKLIEEKGADPNDKDTNGNSSVMIAAFCRHVSVLEYFMSLSGRVNINAQDKESKGTALHTACSEGFEEVVRILLDCPLLDVNKKDVGGYTALHYACEFGHEGIVSILLGHPDIQVNKENENEIPPLILACERGNLGMVRLLLSKDDIDVNAVNECQITALMSSCGKGVIEIVRCLLDHEDIDVNFKDSYRNSALSLACDYDQTEIISMLLQREDLQKTTRNLELIKDFVMRQRRQGKRET